MNIWIYLLIFLWNNIHICMPATLSPLIRVWFRITHTIPWVWVNTMVVVNTIGPCLYHESMSIPWVQVYTIIPCLYHESMSIPWVLVNSMRPCLTSAKPFLAFGQELVMPFGKKTCILWQIQYSVRKKKKNNFNLRQIPYPVTTTTIFS